MNKPAPLQVYHELIDRIGLEMRDAGIEEITRGNVTVSISVIQKESDTQNTN